MFNATKTLIFVFFVAAIAACSNDSARREAAAALVEQARSLSEARLYDSALVVLDTLDISYRDCLDARREGTVVRLSALSSMTRDSLAASELQLRTLTASIDSMAPRFRKVEVAGTEGYYVDSEVYTGSEMNTTGIQARIDDRGYCFIVANVARRIGLNAIMYGDIDVRGQSIDIEGSEIMSVTQEPATPFLNALSFESTNPDSPVKLTLVGSKGKVDVTLSSKQHAALSLTWRYALALQQQRSLNIRLEKLERQLARLSDQLANQTPLPTD